MADPMGFLWLGTRMSEMRCRGEGATSGAPRHHWKRAMFITSHRKRQIMQLLGAGGWVKAFHLPKAAKT